MSQGNPQRSNAPKQPSQRLPEGDHMDIDPRPVLFMEQRIQEKAAAEASGPAERNRTSSAGSPTNPDPAKRTKTGSHHVINFPLQKPAKNRPTSFDHLSKPDKMTCAVMIDDDLDSIMGHPLEVDGDGGGQIKLNIEPGRYGEPSIGFDFKIRDPVKPTYNTFTLGWEPGIKIGGQWMLQDVQVYEATKQSDDVLAEFCYPQVMREIFDGKRDADRLFCLTFKSNAHKASPMDVEWAADWPAGQRNFQRIYNGMDSSYQVTVWFCIPTRNTDRAWNGFLTPFTNAVKDHTPPFHQYLDDDDQPYIQEDLPTVAEIGDGMYKRYPKVKSGKISNRTGTVSYHTLPRRVTWNSIKSFHVMQGVPIIRDMQYCKGLHIGLEADWHRIFLRRMPALKVGSKSLHPNDKMKNTCLAGIRLATDSNGKKEAAPETGVTIIVEFSNENRRAKKPHQRIKQELCFGQVTNYGGKSFLQNTGTDFAVLLTMPRRHQFPTRSSSQLLPDEKLAKAKIEVRVNLLPAKRDAKAFRMFCNENHLPELLDPIRLAMWSEPSRVPGEVVDLTEGPAHARSKANSEKYREILRDMQGKRKSNKSQDAVLMTPSAMKGRIAVVQGPPGAGKTRTLRDMIIALAKVGHKVLCVASSNAAVDTDAQAVWDGLTKEDRKVIKCLRLETNGAEKIQRLNKLNHADYTGQEGEADKLPENAGPEMASDNPAIRQALDMLCAEWAVRENAATKAFEQYHDLEKAFQAVQDCDCIKKSNVPNGMTLDFRQWEITQDDKQQARIDYEAARKDMTPEQAPGIDVNKFDKSFKFRDLMGKNVDQGGLTNREDIQRLEMEVDGMTRRTFRGTHIMLTTASNCGGAYFEDIKDFAPTIIIFDEAGQIGIPGFTVPLTMFDSWEGVIIVGDTVQLEPTILSGNYNEFIANGKLSPLALLSIKDYPSIMLEEQYRMAPACSKFPRTQFYNGKGLKDSDSVLEDNAVRQAIRKLTKWMGIQGDNKDGSEYVVTDVVHGNSRVELGGTSLVNYANADVIKSMVQLLLFIEEGLIKPRMIKILTYYQGQRRLLREKLAEMDASEAVKNAIEISTVESFQGKESQIVIIDMVAAKGNLGEEEQEPDHEANDEEGDEDPGTETYIKAGRVTSHVRSTNRLNVALTRGQDATLVVCQAGLLAGCLKKNRGKHYNAVVNLISDAQERNCFYQDFSLDSHPESVKRRAQLAAATLERNTQARNRQSLKFILEGRRHWDKVRNEAPLPTIPPYSGYRVPTGHTTRPIGKPNLVRIADEFDEAKLVEAESIATAEVEAENR